MVNFYESNANFYNSSAFLTTTLMDYLRVSVGKTVRVVFPRISKFTDFGFFYLLGGKGRELGVAVR